MTVTPRRAERRTSARPAKRSRVSSTASVVLVTVPSAAVAEQLARALLAERLIACATIVPGVRSIYAWKGTVCDDREWLMVLKTRSAGFERLRERIVALHPYEVPEVLRLDVAEGHAPYLAWLLDAVPARATRP